MNEVEIVVKDTNKVGPGLRAAEDDVKQFGERVKRHSSKSGDDSGKSFADKFGVSLEGGLKNSPLFSTIGNYAVEAIGGAAVVAAPAVGASVAAAILGGAGLAGLGAGIALSLRDPAIHSAAAELGDDLTTRLTKAATTAFRGPMLESIQIVGDGFDRLEPRIERIFAGLAPHLTTLVSGAVDAVERLGPSLEHTFDAAGPVLDELAADMGIVADGASNMLDAVSRGGPGAVQVLRDLSTVTAAWLSWIGLVIEGLSKTYDFLRNNPLGALLTGPAQALLDLAEKSDGAADSTGKLKEQQDEAAQKAREHADALNQLGLGATLSADDFKTLSDQINATAMTTDVLAGQMADKLLNSMLSLDTANLSFAEGLTRVSEAVDRNGTSLDIHTAKGQANERAILGVVRANQQVYDANIAAGMSAQDAAAAYDSNTAALEQQMHQAGFTQGEIDGLIGKYRAVPSNVNTAIAVNGLTAAINDLSDLLARINGIPRFRYSTIIVTEEYRNSSPYAPGGSVYRSQVPRGAYGHGGIVGAQGGGPRSGQTIVGEYGIELADLAPGTRVHSHEDSMRILAEQMGSRSGTQVVELRFSGDTDSVFATAFMKLLRTDQIQISSKYISNN